MDAHRKVAKGPGTRDLSSVLRPKKAGGDLVDDDDADLPPPYTELPELHVLPSYRSACPLKPYRPFPQTMRAHHRLSQLNSITLSGPDKDRLYYVEVHKGFQHVDPLGYRAGVVLRNGPRGRDEVLAAAGEEMQSALRIYAVPLDPDPNSVFFLPPLEFGTNSRAMAMERMRPGVLGNRTRAFTFFVEVEPLRSMRRQKFVWVQDTDGDDGVKMPGFRLVRVMAAEAKGGSECDMDASASASASRPADAVYGETVAALAFPHTSLVSREAFTLSMLGSARDGRLGERCEIAIVVTALRIWNFHAKGQLD
ncbi:hypothetical protein MANI_016252 [Metarhizium anisopliae]|nr:hypothetical protein MANI_016252 [Metarhizium anisopliae]